MNFLMGALGRMRQQMMMGGGALPQPMAQARPQIGAGNPLAQSPIFAAMIARSQARGQPQQQQIPPALQRLVQRPMGS